MYVYYLCLLAASSAQLLEAAQMLAKAAVDHTLAQSAADAKRAADTLSTNLPQLVSKLDAVEKQNNIMILQQACSNAEHCSFYYYDNNNSREKQSSASYVRGVLLWFNAGCGHWIGDNYYVRDNNGYYNSSAPTDAEKKAFRDALVSQIYRLTGTKPRMEQKQNNSGTMQWIVYRK